jgi:hypothetical protein
MSDLRRILTSNDSSAAEVLYSIQYVRHIVALENCFAWDIQKQRLEPASAWHAAVIVKIDDRGLVVAAVLLHVSSTLTEP